METIEALNNALEFVEELGRELTLSSSLEIKRARLERELMQALMAPAAQPAPLPDHADHVSEIAARLRLVAKLAECPQAVPDNDHTAVGAIFSVLGNMRLHLERRQAAEQAQAVAWCPALQYQGYEDQRSWINGKPRQEDIDYWQRNGVSITYAFPHPQRRTE